MRVMGIDPGNKGGISIVDSSGEVILLKPMPLNESGVCVHSLREILDFCDVDKVVIEKPFMLSRQGNQGSMMINYGKLLGVLQLVFGSIVEEVSSQKWQKIVYGQTPKLDYQEKKLRSITKAKELFPEVNLKPTKRSKVDSDGLAESLLIAWSQTTLVCA